MFKGKGSSTIAWLLTVLIVLFLAFTYVGTGAGILVLIVVIGFIIYRRRSGMYHSNARKLFLEGDMSAAIVNMKKAIAAASTDSMLHASCGFMYLKMGRPVDAERMLMVSLNVAKEPSEKNNAKTIMSLLLWKQGKLDEAIEMLEEVTTTYKTTTTYATMGFFKIAKGIIEEALAYNLEAYEYNSKNPVILDNYGSALTLAEKYDEAETIYQQLMVLSPTFPDAYYNYGRLLEKQNKNDEAMNMYQTASSKKFWYTSTVTREEVEFRIEDLEEKMGISGARSVSKESFTTTESKANKMSEDCIESKASAFREDSLDNKANEISEDSPENKPSALSEDTKASVENDMDDKKITSHGNIESQDIHAIGDINENK